MAVLRGTDGNDSLVGTSGDDVIDAGLGNDTVAAGDGNDVISDAGGLVNVIDAGAGNDTINFTNGIYSENYRAVYSTSVISAGAGDDIVQILNNRDQVGTLEIDLGSGNDTLLFGTDRLNFGTGGQTTITTGTGVDRIVLSEGFGLDVSLDNANYLTPNDPRNREWDGSSTLVITDFTADAGGDILDLGAFFIGLFSRPGLAFWDESLNPFGEGRLYLVQDGADTILRIDYNGLPHGDITYERDIIRLEGVNAATLTAYNFNGYAPSGAALLEANGSGTAGADVFVSTSASTLFNGLDGDDVITGNVGDDTLDGGTGADTIRGGNGDDIIRGGSEADVLDGGFGDDLIEGGDGNDYISDAGGNDTIIAGSGNDTIILDRPRNNPSLETSLFESITVNAGDGDDLLHYIEVRVDGGFVGSTPNASELIANLGSGNDVFIIEAPRAEITITTGTGTDRIFIESQLSQVAISARGSVTITDFTAGNSGDVLYLGTVIQWFEAGNPFASGALRAVQSGTSVIIGQDFDGIDANDSLIQLVVLLNTNLSDLTAFNFAG